MDIHKKEIVDKSLEVPVTPEVSVERQEVAEVKEVSREEDLQQAKEAIEKIHLDEASRNQANASAQNIQSLDAEKKLQHLLEIAKQKGVVYAVHMAKSMDDPYILDMLHDTLAKAGMYKEFLK